MRISELQAREDYEAIFHETLKDALADLYGHPFAISSPGQGRQLWRVQSLLSGYFLDDKIGERAREYLRDSFRYTGSKRRLLPQYAVGTALTTERGLRLASRPAFSLTPGLANADEILIIPGNQRIRIFDFHRGIVRVVLKKGFDPISLRQEIRFRQLSDRPDFLVPLSSFADDCSWLEEPIVQCLNMARCPPWYQPSQLARDAFRLLTNWSHAKLRNARATDYLRSVMLRLTAVTARMSVKVKGALPGELLALADRIVARARLVDQVQLVPSHGDFQPGNVLVRKADRKIFIIDWEHFDERSIYFDALSWELGLRSPNGLGHRAQRSSALNLDQWSLAWGSLPSRERLAHLAIVLLENLVWLVEEYLTGPYDGPPEGLDTTVAEIGRYESMTRVHTYDTSS